MIWFKPGRGVSRSVIGRAVGRSVSIRGYCLFLCFFLLVACGKDETRSIAALGSGDLHWAAFPVPLKVDSQLFDGGAANEDLLKAIAFWENRVGKTLFQTSTWPSGHAPYTGSAGNPETLTDNVIFFQNPWPFPGNVAGKTFIHSINGIIKNAVVFLNAETRLCAGLCEDGHDKTSRQKLLAHELGHFIGFAHVNDRANIMFPEILPGSTLDNETVDEELLKKLTK